MSRLFSTINQECIVRDFNRATFFEKRVFNDIRVYLNDDDKIKTDSFYNEKLIKWSGSYQKIELPKSLDTDHVSSSNSLKNFILKFGERVMLIFDHIFLEKRVIFIGNKQSPNIMSEYVYTCVEMFCPPLIGLLQRAFPYVTLNNLNFLDIPGYIAGTNNQLFESRSAWYDLACEIDSSKIKLSKDDPENFSHPEDEAYYNMDLSFIKRIISRIKNKNIYDFEIKNCFATYVQTLLDLACSEDEYLNSDDNPIVHKLAEKNAKRIYWFRQTNLYKIYQHVQKFLSFEVRKGVSMLTIENHIRKLRLEQYIDNRTMLKIFYDFSQFLSSGGHDSIIRFLYLLPRHKGGLHIIGNALFSCHERVCEYARECLNKLEESPIGKKYISQLNFIILTKYTVGNL